MYMHLVEQSACFVLAVMYSARCQCEVLVHECEHFFVIYILCSDALCCCYASPEILCQMCFLGYTSTCIFSRFDVLSLPFISVYTNSLLFSFKYIAGLYIVWEAATIAATS